jgi:L-ascorbate metabolism protein UlaG (beta-lactamase superfamily)
MTRTLAALAALLLCTAAAPAQDKPVTIRWHGQSFFEVISPGGLRIVLDPHAIESYNRPTGVTADLILMTHFHQDHVQVDVVENAKKAKQINALKKAEGRGEDWNIIDEKFKDVRVRTMGTYHDQMSGMQRGKNGVFILDMAGLRIVHLGDLCHQLNRQQLEKLGTVDVLMIPVGGVYTLNGLDAQKVVEQIKPKRYIIPMHYGTPAYDELLKLDYFLDDQHMGTVEKFKGNELKVDPKAEAPREPIIAILHYESRIRIKD